MKPTHLITLSARIDELRTLYRGNEITLLQFYDGVIHYKSNMSSIVTLSQFVPCINGVPLDKPVNPCDIGECSAPCCCSVEFDWIREAYNEAQKNVIFEGWEVVATNKIHHHNVFNSELGLEIEFYKEKESLIRIWHRTRDTELTIIQTLAKLAEATTKNPLKLK
jgi:hypothetical protein